MIRALEDDFKRVVGIRQVVYFSCRICHTLSALLDLWTEILICVMQLVSLGIRDHLLVAEC